jgi:hypothetical protein
MMRVFNLRMWLAVLAAIAAFIVVTGARADVVYDPPVGSRWVIELDLRSENTSHENGKTDVRNSVTKITSELTVDAKTADGFRMTYARRKSSYDGNAQNLAVQRAALVALNNVTMKVTTDRAGKPLRVENVADIKAALQNMIDSVAAAQERETAAAIRRMFASMTDIDNAKAAALYLDELGSLAAGQNTGLVAGEVRRSVETAGNPIGPAMLKNVSLTMISVDPVRGDAKLVLAESYEPESLRAFLADLLKRAGGNAGNVKDMVVSFDAKADIEVTGGMTRSLRRESTMSNRLAANYRTAKTRKVVTVTPAR